MKLILGLTEHLFICLNQNNDIALKCEIFVNYIV